MLQVFIRNSRCKRVFHFLGASLAAAGSFLGASLSIWPDLGFPFSSARFRRPFGRIVIWFLSLRSSAARSRKESDGPQLREYTQLLGGFFIRSSPEHGWYLEEPDRSALMAWKAQPTKHPCCLFAIVFINQHYLCPPPRPSTTVPDSSTVHMWSRHSAIY
jgi:hypothetical protein